MKNEKIFHVNNKGKLILNFNVKENIIDNKELVHWYLKHHTNISFTLLLFM